MKKELTDPPTPLEVATALANLPDGEDKDVIRRLAHQKNELMIAIMANRELWYLTNEKKELTDPPTTLEIADMLARLDDCSGKDVIRRLAFHRDFLVSRNDDLYGFTYYLCKKLDLEPGLALEEWKKELLK